jgi:hypothetical protein
LEKLGIKLEPPATARGVLRESEPSQSPHAALPEETAEALLLGLPADPPALESPCVRCGRYPTVEDSDLCLRCRLDLYRSLGDASNDLFSRLEVLEDEQRHGMHGVISAVRNARGRAGIENIDLVGAQRLRW